MKRKVLVFLLCAATFVSGVFFAKMIPSGSADSDGINRSTEVIYPEGQYFWDQYARICVHTQDKYYHTYGLCDFAGENETSIFVSKYEAVERGYQPCPNCVTTLAEIYPDQWNKMLKDY